MKKVNYPALYMQYFDLKIFSISYGPNIDDCVRVVSFDTFSAIALFCTMFPTRNILNITFLGDCISVFPQNV